MAKANLVDKEWRRVLANELNNNMLMDSPKGKTAFACGVAFVLNKLQKRGKYPAGLGLDVIHDDAVKFTEEYMEESSRLKKSWALHENDYSWLKLDDLGGAG